MEDFIYMRVEARIWQGQLQTRQKLSCDFVFLTRNRGYELDLELCIKLHTGTDSLSICQDCTAVQVRPNLAANFEGETTMGFTSMSGRVSAISLAVIEDECLPGRPMAARRPNYNASNILHVASVQLHIFSRTDCICNRLAARMLICAVLSSLPKDVPEDNEAVLADADQSGV
eukprot:scaffold57701_cov50-Prasinocladus_malaysianus.AAC.2